MPGKYLKQKSKTAKETLLRKNSSYDTAYATVGTDEFDTTYGELAMMVGDGLGDIRKPADGWHL